MATIKSFTSLEQSKKLAEILQSWIKRLFKSHPRCEHQWKCVHQLQENIYDEPWDKYPSEILLTKTWECQKCGKIKYITQRLK